MELIIGCRTKKEMRHVESFLKQFQTIHLSQTISERALQLIGMFYHSHSLLISDALIAASALLTNSMLYTKNIKHFRMIPGLRVQRSY
jgi:predicted nucleic acid-binding protein